MSQDPYRYFRIEAREILEGLGRGVLELEKGTAGGDLVARLLRLAHTLKGAARVVKQPEIAELAHAVEDALEPYRDDGRAVPRERIDDLLALLDTIAVGVASLEETGVRRQASGVSPGDESAAASAPALAGLTPDAWRLTPEVVESVRVEIGEMDALLDEIGEASTTLTRVLRQIEALGPLRRQAGSLAEALRPRPGAASPAPETVAALGWEPAEDLRRSLERFERGLTTGIEEAHRRLSQVRRMANEMRLVPAGALFAALERAARDVAQSQRKSVTFETAGGEHRVDAHVLAALRDALLHVVRNAVAHGIEAEPERLAAGKPTIGRVDLLVERRGNRVAFVCRDDGHGVDVEAVRTAAVQRGLIAVGEAAVLGAEEIVPLILRGGMSTAGAVTEVSGRGIGLDVVRETAARLKGDVVVRSERGRGTVVEICVPASLASLPSLVVEVAGMAAALPLDAVLGTLRLSDAGVARSGESDGILYDGRVVPFLPLAKALRRPFSPGASRRSSLAVVLQWGTVQAAVGVDRLLATADVIMKPLPSWVAADPVIAGASLDAEGNPQLVLDPRGLVAAVSAERGAAPEASPAPRPPVLVIDDSLTTRMLEQSILESAGYEVDLAISAEEGLDRARRREYGLFIVDVELPGMDGYEFVARVKGDPVLRETPMIMVTSRGSADDRRRGQELGAHAYMVKSEFDQEFLLRTIRELVG